jgi:enediyne biosynthesis protein E4
LDLQGASTGALITWSAGDLTRSRLKTAGGTYLSANDPREVLGLGKAAILDWVEVRWPGPASRVDRFENVAVDRYYKLKRGGHPE